jgi:hypothetical protein
MIVRPRKSPGRPVEPTQADLKARAERLAQTRAKQKDDAPRAMADYRAAEDAVRLRTEKLRSERLAREAAATIAHDGARS